MSRDLVKYDDFDLDEFASGERSAEGPNPLLLMHRVLRGRYVLAVLLGGMLAAPMAVLGYMALPPKYTSNGRINIKPTVPVILHENEFTEGMTGFDGYVESQSRIVQDQNVLARAVENESLRGAGWPALPEGLIALTESLQVRVPRRSQDILVSVTHENPRLAQLALNSVLDEYETVAIEKERTQFQQTIETLEEIREDAQTERDLARSRAFDLAEREGTDDLSRLLEAKHEELRYLNALILEIDVELPPGATMGTPGGGQAQEAVALAPTDPGVLATLAQTDRELAGLLTRRQQVEFELSSLRQRFGPRHRQILALEEELVSVGTMIEARAAIAAANNPVGAAVDPLTQLVQRRQQLIRLRDDTAAESRRIGRVQLDIDRLREEASRADENFQKADDRLESLRVQQQNAQQGRISIAQTATMPLAPSTDRRLPLAVVGAGGGFAVGVGLVTLLGLFKPKYRFIDEVEQVAQHVRIMGAVPELDAADSESDLMISSSVHQIRNSIDARLLGTSDRGMAHLITSATAGEGKSTISLRLARSFAVSSKRTLLIDADMIGRRITAKHGLESREGFADVVAGRCSVLDAVKDTGEKNLFVLPTGLQASLSPEEVSARLVASLLGGLREAFDAIVIDSGPILGSLEAQSIVPAVDEVLLIVSRGRNVRHVRIAIDRLQRLGAPRVGIVFNRASSSDFERSTSMSMTSQRMSRPARPGTPGASGNGVAFGAERSAS